MNTTTTFTIIDNVRTAWDIVKKYWKFFVTLAFFTLLLSVASSFEELPVIIEIILTIASFLLSIVWLKVSMAAARNNVQLLSFKAFDHLMPTWKEAIYLLAIGICSGILIILGFVLLIIPGIYIASRLAFASYAYLDQREGVRRALRYSWDMSEGYVWKVIAVVFVSIGLYIIGIVLLGVGLLMTYPLVMVLIARLYVTLKDGYDREHAIISQPAEIDLPTNV